MYNTRPRMTGKKSEIVETDVGNSILLLKEIMIQTLRVLNKQKILNGYNHVVNLIMMKLRRNKGVKPNVPVLLGFLQTQLSTTSV